MTERFEFHIWGTHEKCAKYMDLSMLRQIYVEKW